ncbi:4-phosphoerythronate dehydrogenase [Xylanibacter rodentium]|jgi:erythronate-4-phosphate dehydrogenase|uniref:Erythronate-4-phosphate dehydrogenase n=1 Tax=Xylanibacter rodentium TaxID=2736289 RepID=A0ABX2AY53_9BACT|nr:4-phosphoerythronate dehydrogenase [Xylanibacter rodentium]NPE12657.1 4-phosphoerythronate dehydrogenase [Prevotella sp. PJ1A]NPE15255.1 4-phosphoerythronate dehydrogenase [Xylanibacter rodentium]NPE40151.1 4-phosphoerythronate dehydrogenase [Prevotella sp. PCJ2]
MKIVIDDKIPYIRDAVAAITDDAVYMDGSAIKADDVRDADAMIVRTRTRCDERLLGGSRVRFVGTATIGYDHLDTAWLDRAGICWTNCPGCNASSVAQYLRSVLILLARFHGVNLVGTTIGIVGCGHVGTLVCDVALSFGMRVLVCDPPVGASGYVSLETIEREADIITFHVPLTRDGAYPTYHLADEAFFSRLVRRPFIINTSRGAVVDNGALLRAIDDGIVRQAIVDTWEREPHVDLRLLDRVYIGTPHIAGYSADGKANADNMVLDALCRFFGVAAPPVVLPPPLPSGFVYTGDPLQLYNPLDDSRRLKAYPDKFEYLRGNYPLRRETAF